MFEFRRKIYRILSEIKKLGIGLKNIEEGIKRRIAYFPGLSFSAHEKFAFNFEVFPFVYSYPGYEPLDIL